MDHRNVLQSVFQKMFFQLEINETLGLVYLKPESNEIEEKINFQMHRRKTLSMFGSVLALYLRKQRLQFYMNPNNNEIPLAKLAELREYLQTFNQLKIDSQFERIFRKGIDELIENQLIKETQEGSTYYEITPICEILLPADTLNEFETKIKNYFLKYKAFDSAKVSTQNFEDEVNDVR